MARKVVVNECGGSEQLKLSEFAPQSPGSGEVLIKHEAIGLNYIDVYFRTGLYPAPQLPFTLGFEGSGVIEAVGEGVSDFAVGDEIAYAGGPLGAYATHRVIPADRIVKKPANISFETAAAMMLKGMTAQYLLRQTYNVKPGDHILFHAAAGGVGLIACQWAKHLGATVIGTVGSEEKAELARAHGCDHPILYRHEDVAARVREITDGKGVPVVYDSIGKDTLDVSLDSLALRGLMVSFGNASGPITDFNLGVLSQKGSLYITRPTLFSYIPDRASLDRCSSELFDVVANGHVNIEINQRFDLDDVVAAHDALEGRQTTGSTILLP